MSQQLVLSIDNNADQFRWCWLHNGHAENAAAGDLEALKAAIGGVTQQVWLMVPGAKVITRELEYTEKEKKHLRSLLPYQLEEAVIGDVEDFHFALGDAAAGKVVLAYTDKSWLRSVFQKLGEIGIEITRCWSAPLLLPLSKEVPLFTTPVEPAIADESDSTAALESQPAATWVLDLNGDLVNVRTSKQLGFSLPRSHFLMALSLLMRDQTVEGNLPFIALRAASQADLDVLRSILPVRLSDRVSSETIVDEWQLDFAGGAVDLCQAEFSQRLPLERWWKLWRGVGQLAAVTLAVYLGVLMFDIYKLNKQSLLLRQQVEQVYRTVVPHGPSDDPEKRLRIKLSDLQPKTQTGGVVNLLAGVLPIFSSNPEVQVKVISFASETGDININVQSHSFNTIDSLRQTIENNGYHAELLSANAQGDINTARLKINKPAR